MATFFYGFDVMFMKSLSDGLAMPRGNGSGPHVLLRDDAS